MGIDRTAFSRDRQHLGTPRAASRALYYRLSAATGVALYRLILLTPETLNRELLDGPEHHVIRPLRADELDHYSRDPANHLPPHFVADAQRRQDVCIGVLDGDELAGFGWYATQPTVVEDGFAIHFGANHLYMFHGYTKPNYRGQALHGRGLARAMLLFAERGYTSIVSLADWANYASLASAYRVGFRDVGIGMRVGRTTGAGRKLWLRTSRAALRHGLRFEASGARLYSS